MRNHLESVPSLIAFLLAACNNSPLTITPPRVTYGGRAVAIAVRIDNDKRIFVASETGGLFRTFDGGKSWQHLDNLPNNKTIDVAIASLAPDVIIATTWSQYRRVPDGGIWRSTDGGGSWTQASGWAPPPSPGCPSRPNAYGISHMPLTRTFYVGTDCGLAISKDNGATWSYFVPEPGKFKWDSTYNRVRSVLVINRSSGVLATDRELWRLNDSGSWAKVDSSPAVPPTLPPFHAFAAPYWASASIFFYAAGNQTLWVSPNSGAGWSQVPAPSAQLREAFVRVSRPLSSRDDREFDVYYGDGMKLHRQTFAISTLTGSGSWTNLPSDHDDPADIGFDGERRTPILLASDGGVHLTSNNGATWKLTGGGYGGFTALQITEVTGQEVSGSKPHMDLYYVSHDDDFKASPDGGATWPGYKCCEGKNLRVLPTSSNHTGTRVTALTCGPCSVLATKQHFESEFTWSSAPGGNANASADAPFPIAGDTYVQSVANAGPPKTFDFYFTSTAGNAWSKSFTLTNAPVGPVIIAGPSANPTIFQGIDAGSTIPNGGKQYGLLRITGVSGQATIGRGDSTGLVGIGSMRNTNATRLVVGVDPQNPGHLIAADAGSSEMKFSADGGRRWYPLPQLTTAVTDGTNYLFSLAEKTFSTTIAWDPYDSCHILVGTQQNGIIRSTDGGNSWQKISGSQYATAISSFYFPSTGHIWVSSDGRGLWTLSVQRNTGSSANACRFPAPPGRPPNRAGLPVATDMPRIVASSSGAGTDADVESGGRVRISGSGFAASSKLAGSAVISVDDGVIAAQTPVAADGSFSLEIPARALAGEMIVTATQQDGDRQKIARTTIDVRSYDKRR